MLPVHNEELLPNTYHEIETISSRRKKALELFEAIQNEDIPKINKLISNDVELNKARFFYPKVGATSFYWTPLQFAAYKGNEEIVKLLLDRGAEIDLSSKGWTALHHAAHQNQLTVVQLLLQRGANRHAKTMSGRRPVDLATDPNVIEVLRQDLSSVSNQLRQLSMRLSSQNANSDSPYINDENSIDGKLEPEKARRLSMTLPKHNFVVTNFHSLEWCHYCGKFLWGIKHQGYKCSICSYIAHKNCMTIATPFCHKALTPSSLSEIASITNSSSSIQSSSVSSAHVSDESSPPSNFNQGPTNYQPLNSQYGTPSNDVTNSYKSVSSYLSTLGLLKYLPKFEEEEIDVDSFLHLTEDNLKELGLPMGPRSKILNFQKQQLQRNSNVFLKDIILKEKLGSGSFGEVYRAVWLETSVVCAKRLYSCRIEEFQREAKILQELAHPNIVSFFGLFCQAEDEYYIVTELVPLGNLKAFLEVNHSNISQTQLAYFALDVAAGMRYLEARCIVHRDLAARNLLVKEEHSRFLIKISDFGLSRLISDNGFYELSIDSKYPIKWAAPEIFEERKVTSKSDVYSYGIVLQEIFEFGKDPFLGMTNIEAKNAVLSGYKMEVSQNCPPELVNLVLQCWEKNPMDRPSFKQLFDAMDTFLQTNQVMPQSKPSFYDPNTPLLFSPSLETNYKSKTGQYYDDNDDSKEEIDQYYQSN